MASIRMTILDPVQLPTTRRAIRTTGKLPVAAVILPLGNEQCGGSSAKLNDDSALERSALPPPIKLEAKETKAVAGAGRTSRYPRVIRPTLIRCPGDSPASGHRGDREKCQTATLMKTSRCCQSHRADPRTSFGRSLLVPRRRCPVLSSRPAGAETCRPQYWRRDDRN